MPVNPVTSFWRKTGTIWPGHCAQSFFGSQQIEKESFFPSSLARKKKELPNKRRKHFTLQKGRVGGRVRWFIYHPFLGSRLVAAVLMGNEN
jgi:hypothetical protein